jgi:hypothetical protein
MVPVFVANGEETELGEARVGVEHHGVGGSHQRLEFVPHGEALGKAATVVLDSGMSQARVRREHLEVLARTGEDDFSPREGLFGGSEEYACHCDIRPEGHAGENNDPCRFVRYAARPANALIPREVGPWNRLREEARVDIAQGGLEAVAEALYEDSKERLGAGFLQQYARKFHGRISGDALLQHFARDLVTRSTSQ